MRHWPFKIIIIIIIILLGDEPLRLVQVIIVESKK